MSAFRRTTRGRRGLLAVLGAAVVVVPLFAATPAAASPDVPTGTQPADLPVTTSPSVTLVTGDRVELRQFPDGRTGATVDPAPRPSGVVPQFHVSTRDGQTHVVPSDVGPLLPEHLDPTLFNVTALLEQGLDDASSPTLPLIVSYPEATASTLSSRNLPAAEQSRPLRSITSLAVEMNRSRITDLGSALTQLATTRADTGRSATELDAADAGPLAGIEKIWLDGQASALLDRSTRQISAPAAWDAGYEGSGTTVAVLDSGIDDTHPDLAGKVVAARDFTGEGEVVDRFGHGTHVASIVAGTGAVSDGARRGVAPEADLVNGKVLDSEGNGRFSWIIAGMEWAAGETDADIVNMSLGGDPGIFGADLMTQAVENLTAEHGTLFVVAAGNNGCDMCINAPGDAPSALTVGAVDRSDQLADFSSRGPAPESLALKPDITAPGVGIMAARADDAFLGGEGPYLELSGTSMAAPHVAGAAALLTQARPDLTAGELKAALMSTAVPTEGLGVYEQGAGRVDIGRLLASPVVATRGSVDFGTVTERDPGAEPIRQSLTYRNESTEPVTLTLSTAGTAAEVVTLEPAQVTVAPGETATSEVVLDVAGLAPSTFTGQILARPADGPALHTPVGAVVQEELFDLTVRGIARDGRPAKAWVGHSASSPVVDVHTGESMIHRCPSQGLSFCMRVPEGTYSVLAYITTAAPWAERSSLRNPPLHTALVGDPEIRIEEDTTLTLDARKAVEVTVDTPAHPEARPILGGAADLTWSRTSASGTTVTDGIANFPGSQSQERLFMQPMEPVTIGSFTATSRWRLEEPRISLAVENASGVELSARYYRRSWFSDQTWQFPTLEGTARLPVVDAGTGTADDLAGLDLDGALALIRRTDDVPIAEISNAAAEAGARMVVIYNDVPGDNPDPGGPPDLQLTVPTVHMSHEDGVALLDRLDDAPVTVLAEGNLASPYVYDLVHAERTGIPRNLHHVAKPEELVQIEESLHADLGEELTYTEAAFAWQPGDPFSITIQRPIAGAPRTRTVFHVSDPITAWSYTAAAPELPYNVQWPDEEELVHLRFQTPPTTYAPEERRSRSWLSQPMSLGLNPQFPVQRAQDWLILGPGIPFLTQAVGMVDAEGHFTRVGTIGGEDGFSSLFQVLRGDETVYKTEFLPSGVTGVVRLPSGAEQTYQMIFEVDNNAPWAHLATETRTEWTFRSGRTDQVEVLPLLTVDYDLGVDLGNEVLEPRERRGPNRLALTVGHQGEATIPVTEVAIEVSYDDGRSWDAARVKERRGQYTVHLRERPPRGAEFVSLRVTASDAAGNRIEQEIIRAAAVPARGPHA